jgi:hypothetical protein
VLLRQLYHSQLAESEQQQQEQKQQQQEEELSELQQQLLTWYRKTCLVAGAGMAGSTWFWYTSGRGNHKVFLPPRAQALPPQVCGLRRAWFAYYCSSAHKRATDATGYILAVVLCSSVSLYVGLWASLLYVKAVA